MDSGEVAPIQYEYHKDGKLHKVSHESAKARDFSTRYKYDRKGNLIDAFALGDIEVHREYDAFDQLVKEEVKDTVGSYAVSYSYDKQGRRTSTTLPDGSRTRYTFDAFFPRKVVHYSADHELVFTHGYEEFDLSGNLTKESLYGCGQRYSTYDANGVKVGVKSDFLNESIVQFGHSGEVLQVETQVDGDTSTKNYGYDTLYQLIQEPDKEYVYDGLRNRTAKNQQDYVLDGVGRVQSDGERKYSYDKQGRLIQCGDWQHQFDPLGHLLVAAKGSLKIAYTYDPFGRRLNRSLQSSTDRFVHVGSEEVGRLHNGYFLECKILGAFNEPLAVIEGDELQVTIDDLRHNIVGLVNPDTNQLEGYNQWSAFGETISSAGQEPTWGYQGKRQDLLTRLIHFGERDYDPETGRWITPDPAGFVDGPNLYQYAWNNPLSFADKRGLSVGEHRYCAYDIVYGIGGKSKDVEKGGGDFGNVTSSPYAFVPIYDGYPLWISSSAYSLAQLGLPELAKGQIGFVNGMMTDASSSVGHTCYLSKLSGGYNIHSVHNATHGFPIDFASCTVELNFFFTSSPVDKLHQTWDSFFQRAGSEELYLQICHSEGAILVRNGLMLYPDDLRKKIIVVAIAPGGYIPRDICRRVTHYVSCDFVPLFDQMGRRLCQDTIVQLQPHPEAPYWDHDFQSQTYKDVIQGEIEEYIMESKSW